MYSKIRGGDLAIFLYLYETPRDRNTKKTSYLNTNPLITLFCNIKLFLKWLTRFSVLRDVIFLSICKNFFMQQKVKKTQPLCSSDIVVSLFFNDFGRTSCAVLENFLQPYLDSTFNTSFISTISYILR